MKKQSFKILVLISMLLLVAVLWFVKHELSENLSPEPLTHISETSAVTLSGKKHAQPIDSTEPKLDSAPEPKAEPNTEAALSEEVPHAASASLEELRTLLPEWLLSDGSMLLDHREINGHSIARARGRYEWESGEMLEIEITDLGADPDVTLLKSLGFNPDHEIADAEDGFTITQDEDWYMMNQEYDYNDRSGSIQLLVEESYLIEVQIEQLPEEAFQEILDADIPYDALFERLDNSGS